jgi:hypothetical protein
MPSFGMNLIVRHAKNSSTATKFVELEARGAQNYWRGMPIVY